MTLRLSPHLLCPRQTLQRAAQLLALCGAPILEAHSMLFAALHVRAPP
ncbi:hypothetical protein FHS55_002150 [Angulomicrobium tetraedrale]|uniref:Uncharacterized protein n=1 Tax=Ancylobacter tetraedralis TaxID=217068 RepID=A0A839Z9Y4_9HYPH|nr:hypothetical protein [Ancylobacter tetraedralis]MBB3771551.1 hypothetical protein [Ancylobacter tetraedralis]